MVQFVMRVKTRGNHSENSGYAIVLEAVQCSLYRNEKKTRNKPVQDICKNLMEEIDETPLHPIKNQLGIQY
jgi:hypothetical protein